MINVVFDEGGRPQTIRVQDSHRLSEVLGARDWPDRVTVRFRSGDTLVLFPERGQVKRAALLRALRMAKAEENG